MNKQKLLALDIKSDFFSTCDTVSEAFDYAYRLIDSLPPEAKTPAYTALHVVVNTLAKQITDNETELAMLGSDE